MTSLRAGKTERADRVVIDSNVWISALVFGGNPRKVFETIVRQGGTIVFSHHIFIEVRRILAQKFPDFMEDFEALLVVVRRNILVVHLDGIAVDVCRDENDNAVIQTALAGSAGMIVSGDKDLLTLKHYKKVTILNPRQFVEKQK